MILVVAIVALFVGISILLYFRVENLQQQLARAKKDSVSAQKEAKALVENLVHIANKQQEFAKFRWQQLTEQADESMLSELHAFTPLINYYGFIFRECVAGKDKLHVAVKKCYDSVESGLYSKLSSQLKNVKPQLRRQWTSNNILGFMALVEGLITEYQKQLDEKVSVSTSTKSAKIA